MGSVVVGTVWDPVLTGPAVAQLTPYSQTCLIRTPLIWNFCFVAVCKDSYVVYACSFLPKRKMRMTLQIKITLQKMMLQK